MLLNLGLSGIAFVGSDVGGWNGRATEELFVRWMALGSVSPFFRNHTQKHAERQEPWSFGEEAEAITRDLIEERYALMPYWYSLFEEASRTGAPVLRPLLWEFQEDPFTWEMDDQGMLGPWLLVAPVLEEGATSRGVYLPQGRWFEYRSGAVLEGLTTWDFPVSRPALPMFVREGAILPRRDPQLWEGQRPMERLYLDLYPGPEASTFELYEDDGRAWPTRRGAGLGPPMLSRLGTTAQTSWWVLAKEIGFHRTGSWCCGWDINFNLIRDLERRNACV